MLNTLTTRKEIHPNSLSEASKDNLIYFRSEALKIVNDYELEIK